MSLSKNHFRMIRAQQAGKRLQEAINKLRLNDFSDLSYEMQFLINDHRRLGGNVYKRLLAKIYTRFFHKPSTYSTDKLGLRAALKRNAEKT